METLLWPFCVENRSGRLRSGCHLNEIRDSSFQIVVLARAEVTQCPCTEDSFSVYMNERRPRLGGVVGIEGPAIWVFVT